MLYSSYGNRYLMKDFSPIKAILGLAAAIALTFQEK
jgi:hypothetical protein